MKTKNTQEIRNEILNKIRSDGVNLSEFSDSQQADIIKTYAAVVIASKQ